MTKTLPDSTSAIASTRVYRPDIDGLRGVAVLAVIVFHAFPAVLPGGFAGVDVFFVISGYLITGNVLSDVQANRFALAGFYVRRIRRIFPALITVLLATWSIGWFCLTGDEYKELGKHILAGTSFVSNWVSWTEAGYFDGATSNKPLLHLWSLGLEEQFYIVWPCLLLLSTKIKRIGICYTLVGLASFASSLWLTRHYSSAAFYLPVSRVWEFAAGGALAVNWPRVARIRCHGFGRTPLSIVALMLCVASFAALNPELPFPGWRAGLPVLGVATLIATGPTALVNRRMLSRPLATWFGKISYALYLWHWPLLSFSFIVAGAEPPGTIRAGLLLVSIMLAWGTTRMIEQPVRSGPPTRWKIIVPCVIMAGVGYLGGMTYVRGGLGFRKGYSPDADVTTARLGAGREFVNLTCGVPREDQHILPFCATDKRAQSHFALWGDSKADALYWGLVRNSIQGMSWTLIGRANCTPVAGVSRISPYAGDDPHACRDANRAALNMLLSNKALTTVVLATADRDFVGQQFAYDGATRDTPSAALDGLDNAVTALKHAGKRTVLVLDNPRLRDPRECMDRKPLQRPIVRVALGVNHVSAAGRCAITYSSHLSSIAPYRTMVEKLKKRHPDLVVFDPAPVLCDIRRNACSMVLDGNYLYSYGDHMSDYASGLVASRLLPLLDPRIAVK